MSHRPIEQKKRNRTAKKFRGKLPAYFDLVQYLLDHNHAKTKRAARELLLAHKVRAESHVLGVQKVTVLDPTGKPEVKEVVQQYAPVVARDALVVLT